MKKNEDGNVVVLFAFLFILFVFCMALVVDVGIIYMQRNEMQDICRMIREDRFAYENSIKYADNPAVEYYNHIYDSIQNNNFEGEFTLYYKEKKPESNERSYKIRIQLKREYNFTLGKLLGFDSTDIIVHIDGEETFGEKKLDMIWHPKKAISTYNGSYTSDGKKQYTYVYNDYPSEW